MLDDVLFPGATSSPSSRRADNSLAPTQWGNLERKITRLNVLRSLRTRVHGRGGDRQFVASGNPNATQRLSSSALADLSDSSASQLET